MNHDEKEVTFRLIDRRVSRLTSHDSRSLRIVRKVGEKKRH